MDRNPLKIALVLLAVLAATFIAPVWDRLRTRAGAQVAEGDWSLAGPMTAAEHQFRGPWLQLHSNATDIPWHEYIDQIAASGADTIGLNVAVYQENCSASVIYRTHDKTVSDELITELIDYARGYDLKIAVMPIVLLSAPRADEWRGKINPDSWDTWWNHYEQIIAHYAALSAERNVEIFLVGSELISTETQEQRWRDLIGRVREIDRQARVNAWVAALREHFQFETDAAVATALGLAGAGELPAAFDALPPDAPQAVVDLRQQFEQDRPQMLLCYSANWDHYEVPGYWDALDLVGMTTYYNINPDHHETPTVEYLRGQWEPIRRNILQWQQSIDRPILFTEVGWANQQGCSIEPWNYYRSVNNPNPIEQANCMESFLRTFADQPWVAGIMIWKWQHWVRAEDHDWMTDTGYEPQGKPVMDVIEAYFNAEPIEAASQPTTDQAPAQADTGQIGPVGR